MSEILSRQRVPADFIGLAEVENQRVMDDLVTELQWSDARIGYHYPRHVDSEDSRGIDIGYFCHDNDALTILGVEDIWPDHHQAVRSIVLCHCQCLGTPLRFALVHSKSRRSGPSHPRDPTPGSAIHFADTERLRSLGQDPSH